MKSFLIKFGFVLLLFAAIMGFVGRKEIAISFSKPVDINVDYPEDYNDVKAVETEIYMLLGGFAEEETTTTNDSGAVTSRTYDYYYVAPVFTEDDVYYVGIKVDSKKSKPYEKISELSWEYLYGELDYLGEEVIEFQGGFYKMDDELYKYFREWFEYNEYFESPEELDKYALPLVLETVSYKNIRRMTFIMIGAFVLGLVMLYLGFRPSKQGTNRSSYTMITINNVNYPSSNFEGVNKLIRKGKTDKAAAELQKITQISSSEAYSIIQNWYAYWG